MAKQSRSRFQFPRGEIVSDYGRPLGLELCTKCHDADGYRLLLFKVHSHPIRDLVDFGYMPPKRGLTPSEVMGLKAWLELKP